jgi:hypothetical protein
VILVDLTYFVVELYEYVQQYRKISNSEEIDIMCKRTQRLLEGRGTVRLQYAFWVDAVVGILYAVSSISSTDYLYLNVVRRF